MPNFCISSKIVLATIDLEKEIEKAEKAKVPSVFLGGSCDDNEWRDKLKKEFKGKLYFIDPYDPDWEPEENIYGELAAIINADYTVFYKGGEGSEHEQEFMNQSDREYAAFDDFDKLRAYLERLAEPVMKKACVSDHLRKLAGDVDPFGHMKMFKVLPKGWPANMWVPICESCMEGKHISYGTHHMPVDPKKEEEEGNLARWGCKNVGEIDGKQHQCNCNAASSEIMDAINEHKTKTAN